MKKANKILTLAMCAAMVLTATACGGKSVPIEGGTEVEIQLYNPGGYGREFLDKWGEEFAKTYKEQGYTIKVTKAEKDLNVEYEIQTPKKTTTDIYFAGNFDIAGAIDNSLTVLRDANKVLLEDLTESFYNSYAIGKDGVEESVKIKDKMNTEVFQYTQYYGMNERWYDKYFYIPWANSVTGFSVNKDLLANTFNLEIPVTTDEMIEQFEIIRNSGTGIAPQVTAMSNAYGWWEYVDNVWWAQYSGAETWENFYKVIPATGNTKDNGYDVYDDDGLEYAHRALFQMLRQENAPATSGGWDAKFAAASELNGEAVYFITGDWLANEMKREFPTQGAAMTMMKTPIISELGVKLRLDGSTSGEADAAKCEEVLRKAVRGIDTAGKTNAEIIAEVAADCDVTLTDEQVEALRVARGIYYNLGYNHQCIVPSFSTEKEIALLFLRFMASDDGIQIFRECTQANLPFKPTRELDIEYTELQRSCSEIANGDYAYSICEKDSFSRLRVLGLQRFNGDQANVIMNSWNDAVLTAEEKTGTVKEQAIRAAKKFRDAQYQWAQDNWASLVLIAY